MIGFLKSLLVGVVTGIIVATILFWACLFLTCF